MTWCDRAGVPSAWVLVLVLAMMSTAACGAESGRSPSADPALPATVSARVDPNAAVADLQEWQGIADRNGGNRAAGTAGHEQSADYVAARLRQAGYHVDTPSFPFRRFVVGAQSLAVEGVPVPAPVALRYSPPTAGGGTVARLAALPDQPVDPTPGCESNDFGPAVRGAIVVVRGGACDAVQQQDLAADAGAVAVLVVENGADTPHGSLEGFDRARIPGAGLSRVDGDPLLGRTGAAATLVLDTGAQTLWTRNVIAQTTTGRPDDVVMAGAHLDSVPQGPGIDDNGSGAAATLETALALGSAPPVTNAVRFAWWGAEEIGSLGAKDYLDHLGPDGKRDIALLVNLDMVASPNAGYFAFDGDDRRRPRTTGSDAIERRLLAALDTTGIRSRSVAFDGDSDHEPFVKAGIPAAGLFTGASENKTPEQAAAWGGQAGAPYDPNYHRAGDVVGQINRIALDRTTRAVASVIAGYAVDITGPDGVPAHDDRQPR